MKATPQISESELEVMKILWELGNATSSQIVDRLRNTTKWKPKTIQTLIARLTAKGAIRAEKTETKAFLYSPLVSQSEYRAYASQSFLQKVYNGSLNLMIASFIKDQKISPAEIDSLKKLLDEEV
jgi:BlaI family penicillinase repressor